MGWKEARPWVQKQSCSILFSFKFWATSDGAQKLFRLYTLNRFGGPCVVLGIKQRLAVCKSSVLPTVLLFELKVAYFTRPILTSETLLECNKTKTLFIIICHFTVYLLYRHTNSIITIIILLVIIILLEIIFYFK